MADPKSGRACTTCDRIEGRVEEIHRLLTGGDEPENGVLIKLDRLREEDKRRQKDADRRESWMKVALGGALSALVLSAWNLVTGGKHP